MEVGVIALFIVLAVLGLFLGLIILGLAFRGGTLLFLWALEQGFIGVAAYFAAWVFLLPLMATASIGIGIWLKLFDADVIHNEKRAAKGLPPKGGDAHHRWANRLPPYDD